MKKVLLFLIIILAVFSLISCDEVELPDDLEACHHLEFKNVWGGLEVVGIGDCECSAVIIPNVHNGKKVISIGNGAFIDCDNITAIVIPGNVKKVKPEAFVACDRLTTVYIQHGVEKLQSMLFYSGSGTMSQITTEYDIYYEGTMSEFIGLNSWSLLGGSARPWYYSGYETIIFTVYCTDGYLEYNYHDANSTPTKNQYDGDIECPYHVDNDKDRICDNCNEPLPGFAHTHTEGEWIIDKEPSVSSEGRKHTECSSCGKVVREEAIAKLTPSQGLEFTLNDDGESYALTGIGTCKDKHVAVPETYNGKPVTKVESNVFAFMNEDTEKIEIPDVKSVSLPDTITEIAEYAFSACLYLEKINIPKNVSYIEGTALSCCNSLVTITVDPENTAYKSIDGNLYTKDGKTLVHYSVGKKDTHFEIPNTVETIGTGAFSFFPFEPNDEEEKVIYFANLKNISIPNSVKTIEFMAFQGCNSLEAINIPDSVTTIGEYAFLMCDSLKTINIPNSITTIEEGTFGRCMSLEDIIISDSVITIKNYAFASCPSIKNVTIPKSLVNFSASAFYCEQDIIENIYFKGTIEDWLNMPLQDVNLLHLGANLYLNDKLLTHLVIPDSVTVLGDEFSGCTSIVSVTIPDSVTRIGNKQTLEGELPSVEFHRGAFQGCTSLKYVNISDSVTSIGKNTFTECTSLESIVIPNSVEYIGDWAFSECTSLESIVIPDSVEYIGEWAFAYCTSLETISLSNSISSIENVMFYGCSSLKSINIPSSVTYIGVWAFDGCTSLAKITIPESITHVDYQAFENCNLIKFTEYGNALYFGTASNPYHILIKAKNTDITSCKIHENTKVIAANAFEGCAYLTSITIPDSVITIGSSAFNQCTKLANVKIGNSLKYIDSYAFAYCSSLSSINIPKSLTSIGSRAFADCTSLTSIIIPISVTNMEFGVFSNTSCIVYCEAEAAPDTWNNWWLAWFEAPFTGSVIWGYKG